MTWFEEVLEGATTVPDGVSLVPGVLALTGARVTTSEVRAGVTVGSSATEDLAVLVSIPSGDFAVWKSDDEAAWAVGPLLRALGLGDLGLDSLTVPELQLAGSVRTGAFFAQVTFEPEGPWPLRHDEPERRVPLELRETTLEVGTTGGADGAYAAISAEGRIGSLRVSVTGSYAGTDGWSLSAALASGESLDLAPLLTELSKSLDPEASAPVVPDFLSQVALETAEVSLHQLTRQLDMRLRCEARLGFDLADPATTVPAESTAALSLDIALEQEEGRVRCDFGGTLAVGGDDPVQVDLAIQSGDGGLAVGSYQSADDLPADVVGVARPVDLAPLAPAGTDFPPTEVDLERLVFAWTGQGPKQLLAATVAIRSEVQAELPVVGSLFPEPGLSMRVAVLVASQDFDDTALALVNEALTARGLAELPQEPPTRGLHLDAELGLGPDVLALVAPAETNPAPVSAPPEATTPAERAEDPGADGTTWVAVQRSFGPVHLARAGLGHRAGEVTGTLEASISLGGLTLSLDGLSVTTPLRTVDLGVGLNGLGLDYTSDAVTVGGSFRGQGEEFLGSAVIATKAFSVTALGAYRQVNGVPSLFVFAAIARDFGGPPAFHVTGLALGVGYNRDFVPPALEAVEHHPFLTALDGPVPDATGMLQRLQGSVPARVGAFWLAAGVRFESFGMIRSRAVVLVRLGADVEILLLGLSELTLPRGATEHPYVRAELALKVSVKPAAGTALAEAMLTDSSYVLDPACRITGRFAFALWFGDHPHSGDFVLSLGGYHPRFRRPDHYPVVPRLGVAWQNGPITIKGEAYFALTPSSVMAGGQLEAAYVDGPLTAAFLLRAHFLISWKPFFYDVEIGVAVRVELTTTTVLGNVVVAAALGADVHLWGPELAGRARVSWGALSFDVEFGAVGAGPSAPRRLGWQEFRDSFLPPPESVCEVQVTAGLLDTVNHHGTLAPEWVVSADQLSLSTRSAVPSTTATWPGDANDPFAATRGDLELGVQPMGDGAMTSTHTVGISALERIEGVETRVPVSLRWATPSLVRQSVPGALWSDKALSATPSADALDRRVVGLSGLRPLAVLSTDNPAPRDLADFATSVAGPARDLPLTTHTSEPLATTTVATTTGYAAVAASEIDDQVVARRDAVIREARSRGFLAEDDVVADPPVRLPVLAHEVTEVFASDPMVGDGRVGGAAARLGVEAPVQRPPTVDLTTPPEVTRLVVRLLAELAFRPYVEAGRTSTQEETASAHPASGNRVLVIDGGEGAHDEGALERSLAAGTGAVFDLAMRGGDALAEHDSLPTAVLDLGEDEGISARVAIVDRHGGLLSDSVTSGEVLVPAAAQRVVVTAGVPGPSVARVCGWSATSTLVRVAPRVFLVEEGLVELESDAGSDIGVLRGAAAVRASGWTRTSLPTDLETVAVLVRRTSRGAELNSSLRVSVKDDDGQTLQLQPEHVVHESTTEVALLFALPPRVHGAAGTRVGYDVQVDGGGAWELTGVLGYRQRPHLVRRTWQPGRTGLAAPTVDPTSTRVVRLRRERQELVS